MGLNTKPKRAVFDMAVGAWQGQWSTDIRAIICVDTDLAARYFYHGNRLDIVEFRNLSPALPVESWDAPGVHPSEAAFLSHAGTLNAHVMEVSCVSLADVIGADRRLVSIHAFALDAAGGQHVPAGVYILGLVEGHTSEFVLFHVADRRLCVLGKGVFGVGQDFYCGALDDMDDEVPASAPSTSAAAAGAPFAATNFAVFGYPHTHYAIAYDGGTGEYLILSLCALVSTMRGHFALPDAGDSAPLTHNAATAVVVQRAFIGRDWTDVMWKGTPHRLSTRHKFFCYNAVTGDCAFECVRFDRRYVLLTEGPERAFPMHGDRRTSCDPSPSPPPGDPEADEDAPPPAMHLRQRIAAHRQSVALVGTEMMRPRGRGSLMVPVTLGNQLGVLLYSHNMLSIPSTGRSTGRVPPQRFSAPSIGVADVTSMLQKRVFAHDEPWTCCAFLSDLNAPASPSGDCPTTYLLSYSRHTGVTWISQIHQVNIGKAHRGDDVALLDATGRHSPNHKLATLVRPPSRPATADRRVSGIEALEAWRRSPARAETGRDVRLYDDRADSAFEPYAVHTRYSISRPGSGFECSATTHKSRGSSDAQSPTAASGTGHKRRSSTGAPLGDLGDRDDPHGSGADSASDCTGDMESANTTTRTAASGRSRDAASIPALASPVPGELPSADMAASTEDADCEGPRVMLRQHTPPPTPGEAEADGWVRSPTGHSPRSDRGGGVDERVARDPHRPPTTRISLRALTSGSHDGGAGRNDDAASSDSALTRSFSKRSAPVPRPPGAPHHRRSSPHRPPTAAATVRHRSHSGHGHHDDDGDGPRKGPHGGHGGGGGAFSARGPSRHSHDDGAEGDGYASGGRSRPRYGRFAAPQSSDAHDGRAPAREGRARPWAAGVPLSRATADRQDAHRSEATTREGGARYRTHLKAAVPRFDHSVQQEQDSDQATRRAERAGNGPVQISPEFLMPASGRLTLTRKVSALPPVTDDFHADIENIIRFLQETELGPESRAAAWALEHVHELEEADDDGGIGDDASNQFTNFVNTTPWRGVGTYEIPAPHVGMAPPPQRHTPYYNFLRKQRKHLKEDVPALKLTDKAVERLHKPLHTRDQFQEKELAKIRKNLKVNCEDKDPAEVKKTLHKLGVIDIDIRKANKEVRLKRRAKEEKASMQSPPALTDETQEQQVTHLFVEGPRIQQQNLEKLIRMRDKKEQQELKGQHEALSPEQVAATGRRLCYETLAARQASLEAIRRDMDKRLPPPVLLEDDVIGEAGRRLHANERPYVHPDVTRRGVGLS